MEVTIEPMVMQSLADPRREVRPRLYRIRCDGVMAGYVHHDNGSGISLIRRYSPIEVTEIENQVSMLKNDLSELPATAMPADVPAEFYNKPKDEWEGTDFDDE